MKFVSGEVLYPCIGEKREGKKSSWYYRKKKLMHNNGAKMYVITIN